MLVGSKVRYLDWMEREAGWYYAGQVTAHNSDGSLRIVWPRLQPACPYGCCAEKWVHDVVTQTPATWLRPA